MPEISRIQLNDLLLSLKDATARSSSGSSATVPAWVSKMTMSNGTLSSGSPSDGIDTIRSYNLKADNDIVGHYCELNSLQVISAVATGGLYIGSNPVADWEKGQWTPRLFNTSSNEITSAVSARAGYYYRLKNIVFLDGMILTSSNYSCHHIGGLPYEPDHGRPSNVYPIFISGKGGGSSSAAWSAIGGSSSFDARNDAYSASITLSEWHISGFYNIV